MKKVISMIFIFLFIAQICCAKGFELTVDTKAAKAGETVTIDLTLSDNPGIIAALFELEYDKERLRLIKAEDKGLLKGAVFSQTYEKYPYIMLWNSSSAKNSTSNGALVTLTFKVLDNAISGDGFIKIFYKPDNVYNADLNNVDIHINNGAISVEGLPPANDKPSSNTGSGNKGHYQTEISAPMEPTQPIPEANTTFNDVHKNDWYYNSVAYIVEKGLMKGTSDTVFSPDSTLTRAMLVTILHRNEDMPNTNADNVFDDVSSDMYYADAVSWAKENKIVSGITENQFSPDANITREQLVAILYRYAMYKNYAVDTNISLDHYDDFSSISEYAIKPMQYAVMHGIIKGNTDTTINPHGNATRAEAATMLYRFLEIKNEP